MGLPKTRLANTATGGKPKPNRKATEDASNSSLLLARGLSARYCGANIPLTTLTADEMERDLRHIDAYRGACKSYSQQYYIYMNSLQSSKEASSSSSTSWNRNASTTAPPLIAMPVRIDPEEEKRLANLRHKIQQCEAQREVLESEYLSLRAHYVHLSQNLKQYRSSVHERVEWLQALLKKRAALMACQRTRLQITREVLAALQYRQAGGVVEPDTTTTSEEGASSPDLLDAWTKLEDQFKHAEEASREHGVESWTATRVPQIPRGVPLLLSAVAKPTGFCAAWTTSGIAPDESMCWLQTEFPEKPRTKHVSTLREEVQFLQHELEKERQMNQDLQTQNIARRKKNDELVAMVALLRTETEAVVTRHNILLESEEAQQAAQRLEDAAAADAGTSAAEEAGADQEETNAVAEETEDLDNDGDDEGDNTEDEEGELADSGKRGADDGMGGSPRLKRRKL
eukprot:Nitzschia sp. Nitz4//scaffold353_size16344//7056//8426//NITZ4_008862-RA/size16344-processed-gene-0.9-mRNA-1//-1//CDS//3329548916//8133//frame0